ncbi:sulfotransferase 6B1 isoform X1 [Aquila chrysaetos chrysaetos]|uniref:sulfotransferase 6B1 isoform X1 n=1 Tax=Aquila chrysaetos chrysaetos TaxID=223781 RepID=UPI001176FE8E|nr:sulfotransferase 6B1 isoform X1 [Aquila chrysaetos chrysaetos]
MAEDKKAFVDEINKALAKSEGLTLKDLLFSYWGTPYSATMCSAEMFQALENLEARRDDMLLVSYPKCGVNWFIQIISDLIFTTIQSKPVSTELPFIEIGDPDKYQRMKQIPSPRILATHLNYDCFPKSIFKNKAKILVLFQNPKDTAVSFLHFHNSVPRVPSYSSWDEFFSEFMNGKVVWGSCFDHAVTWNKHIEDENTMIIIYEDLKENLTASVKQIAEFFGFFPTAEQIQSIADRDTFQAVEDKAEETHGAVGSILSAKVLLETGKIFSLKLRTRKWMPNSKCAEKDLSWEQS